MAAFPIGIYVLLVVVPLKIRLICGNYLPVAEISVYRKSLNMMNDKSLDNIVINIKDNLQLNDHARGAKIDRKIICCDSIEWLSGVTDHSLPDGYCGFTSLPDIAELPDIYGSGSTLDIAVIYKIWI